MSTTSIASWLLTYLIHSTVLLGAAWLVSRTLGERRLVFQETLLRTALFGGILTASLQSGFSIEPLGGIFAIGSPTISQTATTPLMSRDDFALTTDHSRDGILSAAETRHSWTAALIVIWLSGSLLALFTLGRSGLDLRRLLRTRRLRPVGRLVEHLAASMGLRRPVRLSTSKAIAVPFATGIRQPEICCPERVCELAVEHQTGLFAHELAHLARRDPAWQLMYRIGEAIFILQPLNRLIRQRLEEISEHLTDERAVACTGDRLGLARCLVVVAHWGISSGLGVPATAFAAGPRLDKRVSRLINRSKAVSTAPVWAAPLMVCLLALFALMLPIVAPDVAFAESSGNPPAEANNQTWLNDSVTPESEPAPPSLPSEPAAVSFPSPPSPPPLSVGTAPEVPRTPQAISSDTPSAPANAAPAAPPRIPNTSAAPDSPKPPYPAVAPLPAVASAPALPESDLEKHTREIRVRARALAIERENAREATAEERRVREVSRQITEERRQSREEVEAQRIEARRIAHEARTLKREQERAAREIYARSRAQVREKTREVERRAREFAAEARRAAEKQRLSSEEIQRLKTERISQRETERLEHEARRMAEVEARKAHEEARAASIEARRLAEETELKARKESQPKK